MKELWLDEGFYYALGGICDYIKIGQNGKPKQESLVIRTLRWDFLEISFLLTGLEASFKQKTRK